MTSTTGRHTLSPAADAAKTDDTGTKRPYVLADADGSRVALVVSFNAVPAGVVDGAPQPVPGVYALLLADDGTAAPLVPTWDRYTYALVAGETLTLGALDAPMPGLRFTAAVHVPEGVDAAAHSFRLVLGEHGTPC